MNLRELTNEYKQLQDMGFAEDSQVYIDTLDAIEQPIREKGKNIVLLMNEWDRHTLALDNEIKRLNALKKPIVNAKARLRDWLKDNMIESGIDKIESDLFTITLGKAPKDSLVVIEDENLIPIEYKKVTYSINKVDIKKALKDGYIVKGAVLRDDSRGLRIK